MFAEEKAAAAASILDGISSIIQSLLSNVLSIPIIILILILIFRKQILALLDKLIERFNEKNLSEFEVGTSGVKLKFDTSLGKTQVSIPKVKIDARDFNQTSYVDGQYKFRISWDDETYIGSKESGRQLEKITGLQPFPFVVARRKEIEGLISNVNIFVEAINREMTIEQYVHNNSIIMKKMNFEIKNSFVDKNTHSGFIEYNLGDKVLQFQKFVIDNGLGYIITATGSPVNSNDPNNIEDLKGLTAKILEKSQIKTELRNILNSFELVYTTEKEN